MATTTTAGSGLKAFFEAGLAHIQRTEGLAFAVEPYTPEWDAWAQYLLHQCGSLPVVFGMAERRAIPSVTMPAQWPELFDVRYVAPTKEPPRYRSAKRPTEDTPEARERVLAMVARFQRELSASARASDLARRSPAARKPEAAE